LKEEQTTLGKSYQVVDRTDVVRSARFLAEHHPCRLGGQVADPAIGPMVEMLTQSRATLNELLHEVGRSVLEMVMEVSAAEVAGAMHQGVNRKATILRHGYQDTTIALGDRKVRVKKPRLRRRGGGAGAEVAVPAHMAMLGDAEMGNQILTTMMRGVSTRNYKAILPRAATAVGINKSAVSRQYIQACAKRCQEFMERRLDDANLLVIYIDGMVFGNHHVIAAIGVDEAGQKHFLGLRQGASENAAAAKGLLEMLIEKGLDPFGRYLFVIDGSKALRSAISAVFGSDALVQRCRVHKVRNVVDHLPKNRRDGARIALRDAFSESAEDGLESLEKLAKSYESDYPSAAASIREGLEEMFTVDRLGITGRLRRYLVSTNIIESPNAGVRTRTRRVGRWQNGAMVVRWVTVAFLETEVRFQRIGGCADLATLKQTLHPTEDFSAAATEASRDASLGQNGSGE
jgi:putative transposase